MRNFTDCRRMMAYPVGKLAAWLGIPVCVAWLVLLLWRRRGRLMIRDKVVLITGANSGLGEACAHLFFRSGCKVILTGRRREELERVRTEMIAHKENNAKSNLHSPEVVVFDLCDESSLAAGMNTAISIHGAIHILVNNAGVSYRGDINTTHLNVFRKVMEVNYFAQVAVTKAVLPTMVKQAEGTIVFVSSVQGKFSIPFRSAYSPSKHAIQAFSDCLRAELSDSGVRVCVVSPGYIRTNLSLNAVTADGSSHGVMDSSTASGMSPEDAARGVQQAVIYRQNDVVLSSLLFKLIIYLRTFLPSVFFWFMAKRARKQKSLQKKGK